MSKINATHILTKIVKYGDNLAGTSARKLKNQAEVLHGAKNLGPKGVPHETISHAQDLADAAKKASNKARTYTATGAVAGTTAGFIGLHKYHQHKDNKILERLDKMWKSE